MHFLQVGPRPSRCGGKLGLWYAKQDWLSKLNLRLMCSVMSGNVDGFRDRR